MSPGKRSSLKGIAVAIIAVTLSIFIMSPQASGDILGQGLIKLEQSVVPPPVIVPPSNVTYKGSTFAWNYTMVNNTLTGTLRVHVNFNVTTNTEF